MPTQHELSYDPVVLDNMPANSNGFGEHYDEIVDAVEALSEQERAVIELHIWGRMPLREVAEYLHVSKSTAFAVKQRAFMKLREVLADAVGNRH